MEATDAGIIVEMFQNLGLHVAAAFYEGDRQLFVDYVDPKNYQQNTHIKNLYMLMAVKRVSYGIGTAQSDTPKFMRLVFTKARERETP